MKLIKNALKRFLNLDELEVEIQSLREQVEVLDHIDDERESLWLFIDEQKQMTDDINNMTAKDLQEELYDTILKVKTLRYLIKQVPPEGEA